jgi:hypothetical protein
LSNAKNEMMKTAAATEQSATSRRSEQRTAKTTSAASANTATMAAVPEWSSASRMKKPWKY